FKIIYKILKALEVALDYEEFDINSISPEVLKISKARRRTMLTLFAPTTLILRVFAVPFHIAAKATRNGYGTQIYLPWVRVLNNPHYVGKLKFTSNSRHYNRKTKKTVEISTVYMAEDMGLEPTGL
ncbi:MAG: hypothetical protein RR495_06870, partial [Anaerovoracaceae bacterium]